MTDYQKIADDHLAKLVALRDEQIRIEKEIKHTREMIRAAVNMLPDEQRGPYIAEVAHQGLQQMGLTMCVRDILQNTDGFITPVQIREKLENNEYDFSAYKSNPLSSIHSILKRFKPSQVQTNTFPDGTTGYRWKKKKMKLTQAQLHDAIKGLDSAKKDAE
jgi:hypothetical protein